MLNVPNEILRQMFQTYTVLDQNQQPLTMASNISADNANRLYQAVKTYKPRLVLEIGLAYGISALAILTALQEIGEGGKLISIDPYQEKSWKNIGLLNIERAGLAQYHEFTGEPDYFALPRMLGNDMRFEMAYIDGWHIFDYVMMNFFYVDKMLAVGGIAAFNDASHVGVKQTIQFMNAYRRYNEVKIETSHQNKGQMSGQISDFQKRLERMRASGGYGKLFKSLRFRLLNGMSLADRYFQKLEYWEPSDADYCNIVSSITR